MYFGEEKSRIEKRRHSRVSYREAVQYSMPGESEDRGGSLAYDISEAGLRFHLEHFVPLHSQIALNIPLGHTKGSKVITIHGRVAWVRQIRYSDRYQVGLGFNSSDLEVNHQEKFSQYLLERSMESAWLNKLQP